ncbi:MAG: 50S ribosomal protein L13 [Nitrososphaerales archaeon]
MASTQTNAIVQEKGSPKSSTRYVNATGQIAGRMCSNVAKLLLGGDSVVIVNAETTLFSGQRSSVMQGWFDYLKIASVVHPKHGPFHARTPEGILTRMIRGMVPRRKSKGVLAMKRLRVYSGTPKQYAKVNFSGFENSMAAKPAAYYIPLSEIASRIGWKGGSEQVGH